MAKCLLARTSVGCGMNEYKYTDYILVIVLVAIGFFIDYNENRK